MYIALSTFVYACVRFIVSTSNVSTRTLFRACQFPLRATLRGKTTGDELSSHAIRVVAETLKVVWGHLIRIVMDLMYVVTAAVTALFVTLVCNQAKASTFLFWIWAIRTIAFLVSLCSFLLYSMWYFLGEVGGRLGVGSTFNSTRTVIIQNEFGKIHYSILTKETHKV